MREQGVPAAKVCPRCGRCYEEVALLCAVEGSPLDGSRLLPFRMNGRYRMERLLGEGGMGSVFAAHDERLKRSVALKVIRAELLNDPQVRFRLEREARTLAQLQHPSVIALFDSGELDDGSAFLVMELLSGRDLKEVLQASGPGTPAQVAELLSQTSSALGTAHRAAVVHRDIKPANVFLVPAAKGGPARFQAKVLDFGLAKSTSGDAHLTRTGMVMGTPAYMSPEQVQGQEVDARSDLYSLAALGYEALTGRRTVASYEMTQILVDVLYTEPPKASTHVAGLPAGVDEAFAAALSKRPGDRPPDVETWAAGLVPLLASARSEARGWPDLTSGA
jgi:serine/threonine protein kinase